MYAGGLGPSRPSASGNRRRKGRAVECGQLRKRRRGPAEGDAISFEEMVAYLGEQGLTRFKTPEQLEVVDSLPRNETLRKVLKYKLREEFAQKSWP